MSTEQHEALKLADWLDKCEPNFYGESSSRMDDSLSDAVCSLTGIARTQHALIVQMAEALTEQASFAPHFPCKKQYGNRPTSGTVYAVETHGKGEAHLTVEGFHKADEALAAATQYLTRGPKT